MVSVDRNTLISQIVSLNPQLKPDELRKLSDAQLQTKLSQTLAGDNDDFFIGLQIEHSNSVVNLKNYNKKTYTDNNENEITEYLDNDNNILERTTKSTDENGNVTERTVTYQSHKPIHTSLKKNGNTIEESDLTYKTSNDGTDYVEISTVGADKSETVSYVLLTDDNGSIYNDVLFGKAKTKLDGTTVNVSRNKGTLLEQINKPNGKSVLNIYNGNDFQAYDDNDLNKLYQRTDMNGSVRDVLYDGNGNTYSTVNAGDSWAIIAQRYNVPENKLRALNKQKGALKPGQRILIPGEFNADSAPLKRTESPEVAKLKAENAERNRLFKIEQKQFKENFNSIIKNKTIPAANNLSSNITFGKKDKVSIEDFVKNVLHLDTSKEVGKKVLFRLAQLPQEALNKISYTDFEQKQIGGMFAPKTNDFSNASFDDIANALLVRAGINVKYNQEIIADNIKQKSVQSQKNKLGINEQKFSQEMLANIYDNAANMLEQYYYNHGVFDAGTYMEATKNTLDKILPDNILGQDLRGTLHIASDYRKIAQRIRNLHSENPMQFKKEFAQLKKDGIVHTEFNEQNIKEFMNLVQSGNVDINSDKFKKACQKAFGFNGFENTENYTKLWSTAGNVGDIAIMLMTLGASAKLKIMGKTTQATFNILEKGAAKILSKSAAAKGAKLGTSMFMGGNTLAGYTLTKETLNNLSNPMRDAKDWDTWKQTGIASAESFGFGAFGGLLNETVVAPIVKAIEKPAAKATQAVTKAFAEQGELSGKEILQTALKGNEVNIDGLLGIFKLSSQEYATLARTATAKTVGFGTEVAGFTAYETALDTVKDIIDPKTGRLPEDMTLDNLTKYLEEKFGEQFANLGTIKSVSLFLMMSKGGKMAQKAMMTQMIASSEKLNNLKFKKAEINGQKFYEVTYPNGARKIVDMPEQAIALSQFALQMDMITATSEAKDTQQGMNVKVKPDGSTVVKDTPQGMLDVEEHELITKASKENPANRVEEKVREKWQKTDIETTAPDENVDLFNLDTEAGLKPSTPEIKNETTSLILNGKLNENLTKRYDEMGRVFTEIAQRRSADIQKLADRYPNDKQKVADGIVKILSEEFGMQGYEPPIVLKDTQGADGGADWPNGRIIINKEITNLKQLTTMISHEYVHMLQFRDIVVQYGEQGVKDLINNDKSIPQNKKEQAINAALNNPYNKHLIASYNAQKAQSGSVDYYVRRIYKDEFTNTIGTDDMEGYTNQVAEREAYYGGSEHIGNNTTSLDQTNIGMASADGAMAALRARMKAQLMKGNQTHNDVEVKTKKQEPSTQFEIDGDGIAHFKETPAEKLNNLTDFNLPIDETLLNNILNKKFPLAGGNESKLKDSYKKRYAPNHNGIFEEEILDNDTVKFIVKDKTTGKIIRECTYNRVNKQNNVDTFYQYSKDTQETLGYNIDANGNLQSIIIHSKDNEDLKCSINEDSTVEINSKTNSYTITVEEFKQHFGFSPILESKLNKNINLQTNKNIQQSYFNFSKYIDSNNTISYIVDSPNRTQISRKWLIDEQKNTITILNPETEDVIQNISDAKTYIKLLSEIETFAPKNHIQLYLIESMPIEKLKFIKDCLIKGQTNKDLANITTKWKDHWSDFQVGTTTATPNRKLRKEFDKLLQNNIILEDDINITRYDTFDFLKTISIKNKNGKASSLGEEIELLINKQASQEEIDNFLFEMNAPITNKNFMACNLNTTTQSYSGNNNRKCIYNITLKSGTQCVYIDDMVNPNEMMKPYQYQSELVINKEQNYEITGMHLNDDKNKMIIDLQIWSE